MLRLTFGPFDNAIECKLELGRYPHNNQIYIEVILSEDLAEFEMFAGEVLTVATVCISGESFAYNETAIKNYSENAGILESLSSAEIITVTGVARDRNSGFAAPLVTVNEKIMKQFNLI